MEKIGAVTAAEVRAIGAQWTFAPTLGNPQNVRWGRSYECFSEDATEVAEFGTAYIRGFQGEKGSDTYLDENHVLACAKHFIGEGYTTDGVNQGNVEMTDEEFDVLLESGVLDPYTMAVNEGVRTVMVSYNSVNGVKCHENRHLIREVLKGELGFTGLVVSDYNAVQQLSGITYKEQIRQAIDAGVDLFMEVSTWKDVLKNIKELVEEGSVPMEQIDEAVCRILRVKFEAGLFEEEIGGEKELALRDEVGSEEHREIAREAVRKSLVLLKNDKALLEQTDINTIEQDITITQNHIVDVMKSKEIFELQQSSLQEKVNKALDDYANFNKTLDDNYNSEYAHLEENCKILDIKNHLADLEFEKKQREAEIARLESVKDVCPTCGQKLPDVHKVDTTQLHKEYDEFMITYNDIKNNYAETTEKLKQDALKLKESLYKGLDELKIEGQTLRKQLNESIDEVQKHNQELNNSQLKLDKLKLNKENYEKQIQSIHNDVLTCESDIKDLNEKILYNNIEKDSLNKHLEINTKMTTIATRDFRGKLLSNIIEFIEAQAKTYCRDIFDTEEIEFKLDGNNIYIGYLNKSYEALSGGEKQKVDLIVQFSIRDMLSQFLGFTSNILVLDEVFDNLDSYGCQKVIDLITNRFNDVESIFIISHHTELSIPYDKEIVVIKNEKGISSIG